jgi:hypothetical protein
VEGLTSFALLHLRIMKEGCIVNAANRDYVRFAPGAGVEIWAKQKEDGNLGTLRPHFSGPARTRVAVVDKHPYTGDASAEGRFVAYFNYQKGDKYESLNKNWRYGDGTYGGIPFVFDAPDYDCYSNLELPVVTEVQLAAFSLSMSAFETEEEWINSQLEYDEKCQDGAPGEKPAVLQAEGFLPTTILFERKSPDDFPEPSAFLAGRVLETAIISNPVTEEDFSWARISTVAGEMDLVVSTQSLNGYLVEGGVAVGHCYLSGRLPLFAPSIEEF